MKFPAQSFPHTPTQILKEDDKDWPEADRVGRQELEVIMGGEHISFNCTKLGSVLQVQNSKDPEGLRIFYYLVQVRGRDLQNGDKILLQQPELWVCPTTVQAIYHGRASSACQAP